MCVIAWKPEGFTIDEETIDTCWENNDDGGGFMYVEDEQLHVVKGLMTLEAFKEAYKKVGHLPAVLHFRISTHGKTNEENTHPFQVSDKLAFAHNGVITNIECKEKHMSDTWNFNEQVVKPMANMDGKFLTREHNKILLQNFIGGSKLVFLDNKGHHTIINEKAGTWEDGVWFSNNSYKAKKVVAHPNAAWEEWHKKNHLVHKQECYLEVGDFCKVLSRKFQHAPYSIGEVGYISKVHPNGYLTLIFHKVLGNNQVREVQALLHQDDVEYHYIYGAI